MSRVTFAEAIAGVLHEEMARSEELVLLGEAVGRQGGAGGTSRGLLDAFGPTRVRDLPVADRANVALGVGMALGGRHVVVEISSTGRLAASIEVLAYAASVAATGEYSVPLVVRVPYGVEAGDRVDRAVVDMLASVPGLRVVCPADAGQGAAVLRGAMLATGPVVMLESRQLYEQSGTTDPNAVAELGAARVIRDGHHVTLAGWGGSVATCMATAEVLEHEGISAQVVDLVSLVPIDRMALGACVRSTGRLVVVHPSDGELAERVLRVGLSEAFLYLESPLAVAADSTTAAAGAARTAVTY